MDRSRLKAGWLTLLTLLPAISYGEIIGVPGDQRTLRAGTDAAGNGTRELEAAGNHPDPGLAQALPEKEWADPKRQDAVVLLEHGSLLRIHARGLKKLEGRFQRCVNDSLFLQGDQGEMGLPVEAIEALWVHGSALQTGYEVGAGIGLMAGFLGGLIALSVCESFGSSGGTSCAWAIPAFAMGGASAGVIVGGIIGASHSEWRLRYRSADYREALWSVRTHACPTHHPTYAQPETSHPRSAGNQEGSAICRRVQIRVAANRGGGPSLLVTMAF